MYSHVLSCHCQMYVYTARKVSMSFFFSLILSMRTMRCSHAHFLSNLKFRNTTWRLIGLDIFWCPWIVFEQVMLCSAVTEAIFSSSQYSSQPGFLFSLVVSLLATGCRLQSSLLPSRFQHWKRNKKIFLRFEFFLTSWPREFQILETEFKMFGICWVSIKLANNRWLTNIPMVTLNLANNWMMDIPMRS